MVYLLLLGNEGHLDMNLKKYILSALVVPGLTLIFIIIAYLIDMYNGHIEFSEEVADGGFTLLLFSYSIFVFICFIATFIIISIFRFLMKTSGDGKNAIYIVGSFVGTMTSLITLYFLTSGEPSRGGSVSVLWFIITGGGFGIITSVVYDKLSRLN